MRKISVVVLASGHGGNFEAIVKKSKERGTFDVKALITDNPSAYALVRAQRLGVNSHVIDYKSYSNREQYEKELERVIDSIAPDLIVLAGYMRLIKNKVLLEKYDKRIINIHPALLPSFPGTRGIDDSYDYGVKIAGITIHFVDQGVDTGPIIAQFAFRVRDDMTREEYEKKVHALEHKHYWRIIESFCRGRYVIEGRRVRYTPI